MTTPSSETFSPVLDHATYITLLRSVFGALPVIPNATQKDIDTQREAAVKFICQLDPCDPIEAALVARYAAAHYAAIDAFHYVMHANVSPTLHLRCQGRAMAMSRLAQSLHRDLLRQQALRLFRPAAQPAETPAQTAQPATAVAPSAESAPTAAPNPPAPHHTRAPDLVAALAAQRRAAAPRPTAEATPIATPVATPGATPEAPPAAKPDRTQAAFDRILADIAARGETPPTALAA
jgi:hypothetical protein